MTHDDFLDPGTAERMLDGSVAPADAPPGFGPVAELLDAARGGVTPPPADLGALASAARAGAGRTDSPETPTPGRPPVLAKFLTLKAAAVAGVVLLGATSAAAATGSLPGSLQRTAHDTLSHVGVTVPSADDAQEPAETGAHDATGAADPTTTTTAPADPALVPPANPAARASDDATEHAGLPEVEHASADDQGQDATEVEGDHHDGTTTTTAPGATSQSSGGDGGHGGDSGSGGHGGDSGGSGSGGD